MATTVPMHRGPSTRGARRAGHRAGTAARLAPFALVALLAAPATARAQDPGRLPDVHYVPTPPEVVDRMLDVARVGRDDRLFDLGSGDGRIVITAARRFGTRGVGIDIDPQRIRESRANADSAGVAGRVEFRQADLFETDLREATVVTLYLLPQLNVRLRPKLLTELRPGTRVVSHAFDMGDWPSDSTFTVGGRTVHYWVIPAHVDGQWTLTTAASGAERRYQLHVMQQYQRGRATAFLGSEQLPVDDLQLRGDSISFTLTDPSGGELTFRGQVSGREMRGTAVGGGRTAAWTATRRERE